ncbi:MAG: glutamate racemase [Deltaproteobacteria bacterium]
MALATAPIALFDSGVGGLTVLAALRRRLPAEDLVYLGDTARVPYGTRSPEVIARYAERAATFLARFGPKLVVVACNTVSAVALPAVERHVSAPVLGVVEPGAAAAARLGRAHVGVIGTTGTIQSGAYQRALASLAPNVRVTARACPLFVPLAEEGWTQGELPLLVARRYLAELSGVEALVLGCTHSPLLRDVIALAMGPKVALVDSADATADAAAERIAREGLQAPGSGHGNERFYVTDLAASFPPLAARFLGRPVAGAELVDL